MGEPFGALTFSLSSGKIVAIKVHYLVPRSCEVLHKRLLRVVRRIDFCDCTELGVRTEEEIDARAGPLDFVRCLIAPLVHAFGAIGLPLRIHVEQVDEEIIRQRLGPVSEDAVFGLPEVRVQGATVIWGAVSVSNCARSTSNSSADSGCPLRR